MSTTFTVSKITAYIKNMFTQDFLLSRVSVVGEVSNCKYHQSGHIYFTLKDDRSSIACVMFAGHRSGLNFVLKDGFQVEVYGNINIYDKTGTYQLYASRITRQGDGELYKKYLELKDKLAEMGMFDDCYKQPIPKYIETLGVVTAPRGDAVRDIINITRRRNPYVQIILFPALVQGEGSAESIAEGIQTLDRAGVDVIIVGRGGGSIEELWSFNEEIVAQAIFDCETPVISAVGHEADFTIADFVADLRASTPSAGAELAVYDSKLLEKEISQHRDSLIAAMNTCLETNRIKAQRLGLKCKYLSPQNQLNQKRHQCMTLEERLEKTKNLLLDSKKHRLQILITQMKGLSPLDKLNQGYSIASDSDNHRIHSVEDVSKGDRIRVYVRDGYIGTVVEEIYEQG